VCVCVCIMHIFIYTYKYYLWSIYIKGLGFTKYDIGTSGEFVGRGVVLVAELLWQKYTPVEGLGFRV
jgi:hypothetical protein